MAGSSVFKTEVDKGQIVFMSHRIILIQAITLLRLVRLLNAKTKGSLTVPESSPASGNGVYSYGATRTFPFNSFIAANYWVDVIFTVDTASTYKFHLTSVTDTQVSQIMRYASNAYRRPRRMPRKCPAG
jgi:hypothetical protein